MGEIDDIIAAGGSAQGFAGVVEKVASLKSWRSEIGALEDSSAPTYFQSTAAGVAILVASETVPANDREWRIRSSVANFWDSCDDLLHAGGGYSRIELRAIKTTLRGVEDIWRAADIRLLSDGGADDAKVYVERLAKIHSNYPKRRQIARVVAESAGWDISATFR
ncbi:hypothetical protein [Streptomyces niveus]|uniref:hypothetical protein n=1 Tax=Streptomyces niveus TaxID=193462 RepID=UPI00114D1E9F|nr:hypothetical protein [Streptomyces niveus]